MDPRFSQVIETLHPSYQRLLAEKPCSPLALPHGTPEAGVYLLSEGDRHLYVGRSNRIRKRLSNHCRSSATHRMAAFAFRLAREATGHLKATYKPEGSRSQLMENVVFAAAFDDAKSRIRQMQVRTVGESMPINQAILEIYVSVALGTPYNDFDTH